MGTSMHSHRLVITSPQNPRIKSAIRLHERKERRSTGLMLVEGYHELALAWEAGLRLETLYICCEFLHPEETALLSTIEDSGVEVVELTAAVLRKVAYREHPDGWLGLARCPGHGIEELGQLLDQKANPLLVLAENLEKPGNLGAILRSADATGADGILVCEGRTDLYNPNVVRAGKGSLFSRRVVECSNTEAWTWIKAKGVAILAASPQGTVDYWDMDLKGPVAVAVGAEKEGLSPFWIKRADHLVRIPMYGRVNSLNVAQAATLILYEALRQRRQSN